MAGLICAALLSGCGLPRGGPGDGEILAPADEAALPFAVVEVTDEVARLTQRDERLSFSAALLRSPVENVGLIAPGDKLGITVWENVGSTEGVLTAVGQKFAVLQETQVDHDGFIFVPYVGRIRAAGNSPEALRRIITRGLRDQTPDPQVEVRRIEAGGAQVSIIGTISAPGIYPIEDATTRLLPMLSRAGSVSAEPEVARVTLRRGKLSETVWLQDLFDRPELNVALRDGDQIIVERDRRAFTALGALNAQRRIPFPARTISALEALGLVGGLNSQIGNPSGIFVFREEDPAIARAVQADPGAAGPVRLVYLIDLTRPGGMFTAQSFAIRDGDVVYVTEAPLVRWIKILSALAPVVNFAGSVNNLAQ
ncbi:MAG: polysaccharide export protein [Alphaproteobacteria bacterium]|nr:MAG: polysaccharide export protein [Alphaproteobacteria bacterium]